ncbi:MAG: RecQ family ATP-dependent DNA helicase [Bacteroidetes bacterium]|nr:RecQ family ATP-dependent DNA helicase [Bacteroidota bacterium]
MLAEPLDILKKHWGFSSFRSLQEDIILSVLDGKDTLALMPTGGGKSICFQVPALCREGLCIVVSPLIALMKDQVYNLQKRNIPSAAIYSGMHYNDIDRTFDNCVYGKIKLLYLSPERLTTDLARERIRQMKVNLLAIDEAHCISQWGYDFRPPYLQISEIRDLLPTTPLLALTATATSEVVEDIQEKLKFKENNVFRKSFERNNLAYVVLREEAKREKLLEILTKIKGSGIVYAGSRRTTKETAVFLQNKGIRADFYHAGLSMEERSQKQGAWLKNQQRIMVSTNAFGMGIDKSNVRVVVHMDLPESLEAYFQEAGRAGRDGKKAFAVLLYNDSDRIRLEYNYEKSFPSIEEIRQVYRALGSYFQLAVGSGEGKSYNFDIGAFIKNFKLDMVKTYHCLKILEQAGWIVLTDAVFTPSSLKILVTKEQLYDYQLRNKRFDVVIKAILRTYQGVFQHPVKIREKQLARFLKISTKELIYILSKFKQDQIFNYLPQTDAPQLIFLQERVDANDLSMDQKLYQFRKKRHLERINKAIDYAQNTTCRSRQLLEYFDEKTDTSCGVCDVCLGRHRKDVTKEDFERYKKKIEFLLQREALTLDEILDSFPPNRRQKILTAVQYLIDEGFLMDRAGKIEWKK